MLSDDAEGVAESPLEVVVVDGLDDPDTFLPEDVEGDAGGAESALKEEAVIEDDASFLSFLSPFSLSPSFLPAPSRGSVLGDEGLVPLGPAVNSSGRF